MWSPVCWRKACLASGAGVARDRSQEKGESVHASSTEVIRAYLSRFMFVKRLHTQRIKITGNKCGAFSSKWRNGKTVMRQCQNEKKEKNKSGNLCKKKSSWKTQDRTMSGPGRGIKVHEKWKEEQDGEYREYL